MAINPTVELTYKAGEVKKINAESIFGDMRSDALWYSKDATVINSVPTTLSNKDKEWLIWNFGETVKIKFTADKNGNDGQGFIGYGRPIKWTLEAVSGTVYVIGRKFQNMSDTKATLYANPNRVAVSAGYILLPGDALLCSASSNFTLMLETDKDVFPQYLTFGVAQAALAE